MLIPNLSVLNSVTNVHSTSIRLRKRKLKKTVIGTVEVGHGAHSSTKHIKNAFWSMMILTEHLLKHGRRTRLQRGQENLHVTTKKTERNPRTGPAPEEKAMKE